MDMRDKPACGCPDCAGAYAGRWVVVVDEDIDPSNIDEVLWAMATRCNPATDIEFIHRSRSTP